MEGDFDSTQTDQLTVP